MANTSKYMYTAFIGLIALGAFFFLPETASAQFVPCDGSPADPCTACHLVAMGDTILNWLIGILFLVFAVTAFVAGWGMVTSGGNANALSAAKQKMTGAFIGLLLVLAAWLIVDTILMALLDGNDDGTPDGNIIGFGTPWSTIQCGSVTPSAIIESSVEPPDAMTGTYTYVAADGSTVTVPAGDASVAGGGLTDAEVKAQLDAAGIEYKSSVGGAGLRPHVVAELQALDAACGCDITVTSLTDGTHQPGEFSHANGFKADLRSVGGGDPNPELIAYVESLPSAGSWSNGTPLYYDAESCATYAMEGDHIDVSYKTGC